MVECGGLGVKGFCFMAVMSGCRCLLGCCWGRRLMGMLVAAMVALMIMPFVLGHRIFGADGIFLRNNSTGTYKTQ